MIYEAILITSDTENNPYIAPFGIRESDGRIIISPFRPSQTLDNVLRNESAVLNFTDDVRVFAGALTGRRAWPVRSAEKIKGFVLNAALAHRELRLVEVRQDSLRPQLHFEVVHEVNHAPFPGFNRAQAAVIELSILVSRLHILPMKKIDAEVKYLNIALEKTAGDKELEAWGWLMEYIENYKAGIVGGNIA